MGRPREHDERTAAALLAAAERTVETHGLDALSVRGVASDVGTSTRAVYSVFGSKDGLIAALGAHAFDLLRAGLDALPQTDDPAADLVEAGMMFRGFATRHPSLFVVGVQWEFPASVPRERIRQAADAALDVLKRRVARLAEAGGWAGARSTRRRSSSTRSARDSPCSSCAACQDSPTPGACGETGSAPSSSASPRPARPYGGFRPAVGGKHGRSPDAVGGVIAARLCTRAAATTA